MMSPDNTNPPACCSSKEEPNPNPNNTSTKKSNSNSSSSSRPQQEQAIKCPRCDSPNTKFCYYNNYSLTQPRHFCKTCRRYWTKGGALRNVPIGGGCRKNKKLKSSSSSVSRLSSPSADSSSDLPALKFFHSVSPAVDFQLGSLSFPRISPSPAGIYSNFSNSYADSSNNALPCIALDPSASSGSFGGFNYPLSSGFAVGAPEAAGSMNVNSSLASSIESLSSMNQDLHWKLQQQRLAMLFGSETQKDHGAVSSGGLENPVQKPQPILFQNLETPKPDPSVAGNSRKTNDGGGEIATEWFFGNSYGAAPSGGNNDDDGNQGGGNWNSWGDLQHQYNGLP